MNHVEVEARLVGTEEGTDLLGEDAGGEDNIPGMHPNIADPRLGTEALEDLGEVAHGHIERVTTREDDLGDLGMLGEVVHDGIELLLHSGEGLGVHVGEDILAKAVHTVARAAVGDEEEGAAAVLMDEDIMEVGGHIGAVFDEVGNFVGSAELQAVVGGEDDAGEGPVEVAKGGMLCLHEALVVGGYLDGEDVEALGSRVECGETGHLNGEA
jgi:hypothetical protein